MTTRPVTQVAETDVNIASENGVNSPEAEETGSESKQAPKRIIEKNPAMITLKEAVLCLIVRFFSFIAVTSYCSSLSLTIER